MRRRRLIKLPEHQVMNRLGREYEAQGKFATFLVLKPLLDPKNARILPPYAGVANQLQVTLGAVKTLIHRLRKQYAYSCDKRWLGTLATRQK